MAKKTNEVLFADDEEMMVDEGKIVYVLCMKNEARGRVYDADGNPIKDPEYPKRRNLLLRSSINWPGGKDPFSGKERSRGRYFLRYYDGCTTLFIDEQPKDVASLEPLIAGTKELHFINGYLAIDSYETTLKAYCDWASWNELSLYRNKRVDPIFKLLDTEEMRRKEAAQMDMLEEAIAIAKKAPVKHMRIHAKFLKIDEVDLQSLRPLSDDAIRTEYRKSAMHDPAGFLRTFNDKSIHLKHWITLAMSSGEISTSIIPNRAVLAKSGIEICDISGLQTNDGIMNKLIEVAQTDRGVEFKEYLEALYNK